MNEATLFLAEERWAIGLGIAWHCSSSGLKNWLSSNLFTCTDTVISSRDFVCLDTALDIHSRKTFFEDRKLPFSTQILFTSDGGVERGAWQSDCFKQHFALAQCSTMNSFERCIYSLILPWMRCCYSICLFKKSFKRKCQWLESILQHGSLYSIWEAFSLLLCGKQGLSFPRVTHSRGEQVTTQEVGGTYASSAD